MRTLTSLLLLGALLAAPFTLAQTPASWEARIGDQLVNVLRDDACHGDGLSRVLQLQAARPDLDLSRVVGPLLTIYQHCDDARHRRAAAVALGALGDTDGLTRLATLVRTERDPQVRTTTHEVLRDFVDGLPAEEVEALPFTLTQRPAR